MSLIIAIVAYVIYTLIIFDVLSLHPMGEDKNGNEVVFDEPFIPSIKFRMVVSLLWPPLLVATLVTFFGVGVYNLTRKKSSKKKSSSKKSQVKKKVKFIKSRRHQVQS